MKKFRLLLLCVILLVVCLLSGCDNGERGVVGDDGRLTVIATIFPPYDFAKVVGGERVNVIKMVPAGIESHSFEPTPKQIVEIGACDLFLYSSDLMEPWVSQVIDGLDSTQVTCATCQEIPLLQVVDSNDHDDDAADEEHQHGDYDPHVWTDPNLAMVMVDNTAAALAAVDPAGADYYYANAARYKEELAALDAAFTTIVEEGKRKELVFGGRFALIYFTERYGLTYMAAFDSCSTHTEPSAKQVAALIDEIEAQQIPVVYYEELTEPTVAQRIAEATGAAPLLFHTCHNVSPEDMENGVTYLSLMYQNAENLREALR